jgi:hypothetical protein
MDVSLATSLHLDHATMTAENRAGGQLPLQSFVPVGLLSLAAYAHARGAPARVRVTEINGLIASGAIANDGEFYERLAAALLASGRDLVGLMTDADSLHQTIVLAREVKRRSPGTLVTLGGPAASPIAGLLLSRFPWIDHVVRGEGEVTFAELLDAVASGGDLVGINGLSFRDRSGTPVDNPARPVIRDLDDLPLLSFDAVGCDADAALYLDVGRGCPFQCRFCATAPFWNRRFRMKSIDRILTEMRTQKEDFGRGHVCFSHDIFTCNRGWTADFCQRLTDADLGVSWSCSTRTDVIDEELLGYMAEAGCVEIYYGIEAGSADGQKQIAKNLDLQRSRRIVAATRAVGIRPVTGFIVGYPNETHRSLAATVNGFFDFLQVGGHRAHLFTLCPFQQAPMFGDGYAIERPAASFELPLVAEEQAKGRELVRDQSDVFVSLRRFATPDVPTPLIDASEEISSRLVVLKHIWPYLLPHYDDAMEWYERWVAWIGQRNATTRPGTRMPWHGEVEDLLDFLDEEVGRLQVPGHPVACLVQYEREKVWAARELAPGPACPEPPDSATWDAGGVITHRCGMRIVHFDHDVGAILAGGPARGNGQVRDSWVVFVRRVSNDLDVLQVPGTHAAILGLAASKVRISELAGMVPTRDADDVSSALRDLVDHGLVAVTGS